MRHMLTLGSLMTLIVLGLLLASPTALAHMGDPGPPGSGMREPLTMDEAITVAERHLDRLGLHDVAPAEMMEFENHFFAAMAETDTGRHAFSLTIDRVGGQVSPAPGPNRRWNLKYGPMMTGAAHGPIDDAAFGGPMAISPNEAHEHAQQFLDQKWPNATVDPDDVRSGYGYHTMPFQQQGEIIGMLSVHGTTGEVWHHDWHGAFIGRRHPGDGHPHMGHWAGEPRDSGKFPLARFDANGNGTLDDPEFMAVMDAWMGGDLTDDQFLHGMDLWMRGGRPRSAGVRDASSPVQPLSVKTTSVGPRVTFEAQSENAVSAELTVYGLDGSPIFSGETNGTRLAWPLVTDDGRAVANGVYLYRMAVRTSDGQLRRSGLQRIGVVR